MTTQLKSGIIITDNRSIGLGISIENQHTEYLIIEYSSLTGISIRVLDATITLENINKFKKELEVLTSSLIEIEGILNTVDEYKI